MEDVSSANTERALVGTQVRLCGTTRREALTAVRLYSMPHRCVLLDPQLLVLYRRLKGRYLIDGCCKHFCLKAGKHLLFRLVCKLLLFAHVTFGVAAFSLPLPRRCQHQHHSKISKLPAYIQLLQQRVHNMLCSGTTCYAMAL